MSDEIYFVVADIDRPSAEPFMVLRVDARRHVGGGVEGVVQSLHWRRAEAQAIADALNERQANRIRLS